MNAKVYWNFHRKCFSVQVNGRVVAHATRVSLFDVRFRVGRAGRLRVLRERRKNVHAYICGEVVASMRFEGEFDSGQAVYNPYEHETFVDRASGRELRKAWAVECVVMDGRPTVGWASGRGAGACLTVRHEA